MGQWEYSILDMVLIYHDSVGEAQAGSFSPGHMLYFGDLQVETD